jgi:hypothetical protein
MVSCGLYPQPIQYVATKNHVIPQSQKLYALCHFTIAKILWFPEVGHSRSFHATH